MCAVKITSSSWVTLREHVGAQDNGADMSRFVQVISNDFGDCGEVVRLNLAQLIITESFY